MKKYSGYLYRITNLVNGKMYIGSRSFKKASKDLKKYGILVDSSSYKLICRFDTMYLGSGRLISKAIEKYGRTNFKKEIIAISDDILDIEDRYLKSISDDDLKKYFYNLCKNAFGGNTIEGRKLPSSSLKKRGRPGNKKTPEQKLAHSRRMKELGHKPPSQLGNKHTDEWKLKARLRNKGGLNPNAKKYKIIINQIIYTFDTQKDCCNYFVSKKIFTLSEFKAIIKKCTLDSDGFLSLTL